MFDPLRPAVAKWQQVGIQLGVALLDPKIDFRHPYNEATKNS